MIPKPKTTQHSKGNVLGDNLTIMLFGSTGAGKTPLIGELAEYYYLHYKLKTRLYASDKGGWESVKPYVNLGVIDVVPLCGDVLEWINNSVKGMKLVNGKWVDGIDPDIGMYAYEGITSMCDEIMVWEAAQAAKGINIGGPAPNSFSFGKDKELVKVGGNNMGHYKVAQNFIYERSTQSQYLPGTVIWSAGDSRGDDDAVGGVVGPQAAGKALTPEIPRWFKYCFQVAAEVSPGSPTEHVLYLDHHTDMQSKGMAKAISNARVPLAGGLQAPIPPSIKPASLVKALELINDRQGAAQDEIALRLGIVKQ